MRDKGTCDCGKSCIYSHDTAKVKAAKTALETTKGVAPKGGGKGGKSKGKGKVYDGLCVSPARIGYDAL
eukprot:9654293-Heterocapsa_arctica.AAC.1